MVEVAIRSEKEVKNGPIWTQIEVSTFTGDRETSPEITQQDVVDIEDNVWEVVKRLRDPKEGLEKRPDLPLNFTGDITERDIFCFLEEERDIVSSCFIRHNEDFIGIKILWNFSQELVDMIDMNMRDPFSVRNVQVVSQSWVEQHHPELTE